MRGTINAFGMLFILALASGCPLTEDPQAADVDAAVDETGDDGAGGGGGGDDSDPQGSEDGGAGLDMDAGPAPGDDDAGDQGPSEDGNDEQPSDDDSGSDTGKDDAGPGEQPDAGGDGQEDASTEEPDAGQELEPDFGAADLSDDERATLIYNLVKSQNYTETYEPFFEETTDIRPVVVSSHGGIVRVFQNEIARRTSDAWVAQNFPLPLVYPHGSIIVKQTYKTDATTQALVLSGSLIMAKIDTLDPLVHEGKWFYVRVSASDVATRSASCVNCHNGRTATALWPKNPEIPDDPGGMPDAVVPYDYLFIPFCRDPRNTQCDAP